MRLLARYINYTWCGGWVVSLPARPGVGGEGVCQVLAGFVPLLEEHLVMVGDHPGDGEGFLTVSA